jgi:hypothetical protein
VTERTHFSEFDAPMTDDVVSKETPTAVGYLLHQYREAETAYTDVCRVTPVDGTFNSLNIMLDALLKTLATARILIEVLLIENGTS